MKNILFGVMLVLLTISCSNESTTPEYEPFPGFIKGEINGDSFEYDRGGAGHGSDFSYSASWQSAGQSLESAHSVSVRFTTDLCPENNCEWEPISTSNILEIINNTDWKISSFEGDGVFIDYIRSDKVYYSEISSSSNQDNYFQLDTAYINEFDLNADGEEPFENIIVVEGRFYSTLINAEDSNDRISIEASFKGFLDSESEW